MSILLVSELFPPAVGGSAVLFENIYSRLDGTDVAVLTDEVASPGEDRSRGTLRIERARLGTPRWGIAAVRHHARVARRIRALAPRGRAIVHCARALPEGVAALLARLALGPRYVCWTHGEEIPMALASRELTFLTRRVYAWASAAIANSRNTRRLLVELGVPPGRIHVVYPGVDPGRFHPCVDGAAVRRRFAPRGETLLLSVGRLQRRKGHDLAIAALGALRDEAPALRYVVVGDGDERPRLEALARDHGLGDRVAFAGEVGPDELPAYYAACDIFLLPNRIEAGDIEGFGIVFLEAAATGRPAIGGRTGGVPEAVTDGVTGLLVGGTDAGELAGAIRTLARSPALKCRMGEAGRGRVLREFTWERAAAKMAGIQRLLEGRDGR